MSTRWVTATLAAYGLGFAIWWPRVLLIVDEERYVSQALAFAHGERTIPGAEILFPPTRVQVISDYPPGTSLLQTPFVWAFGWRGAALLSVIALVVATIATLRWLRESGLQPAFALLVPGFFGAAFFGRIAMSDVPAGALVAVTCYLLWHADRSRGTSWLVGLCAGLTAVLREPPIVLLLPLLVGAALRRKASPWALAAGFATGIAVRFALAALLFGSALYSRPAAFSWIHLSHSVPVYAFVLLFMFPGGALLPFLYRGSRRAELVTAVLAYVILFLLYEYDSVTLNGPVKGLILASRFMVPLAPILAYMAADVWPRLYEQLSDRLRVVAHSAATAAAAATVLMAATVHFIASREEPVPLAIIRGLYANTTADSPVITNSNATLKYLSPAYGPRRLIIRYYVNADSVVAFGDRYSRLSLALLDRTDSRDFRLESQENERFVESVGRRCRVIERYGKSLDTWARLRVFDVSGCR